MFFSFFSYELEKQFSGRQNVFPGMSQQTKAGSFIADGIVPNGLGLS
jgi:hypothetical protein